MIPHFSSASQRGNRVPATNEIEYQAIQGSAATVVLDDAGQLDFRPSSVPINRPRTMGVELSLPF